MRERLYHCFHTNQTEVILQTLAAAIMPSDPDAFIEYIRSGPNADQYQINNAFTPHKTTYNKLRRITGKVGTISVGFNVDDVQAGRITYDPANNGIVIKSPSEQLIQAILDNASSN